MHQKYKIAYILTSAAYGGLEKVASIFINTYNRKLFDIIPIVMVRADQIENPLLEALKQSGHNYHKIYLAQNNSNSMRRIYKLMQLYRVLHGIIRDNSFDLVHSNGTLADVLTIPIAMYLRKPILSTCHGLIATRTRLVLYNYLNRRILRFSNAVIAVSDTIRVDLEKSGVKGSRISVIPNALCGDQDHDSENANRVMIRERLGISEKDFVIGYVGRLSEEKGLEYLIKATAIVIERNPQVKLLIIGEGPDRNKLKIIAHRENIDKNIYFMGFHTNISPWLSAMDLFVLPSLTEGTPMALLEAMAHGLPVAASCVGGIPDIVNSGKNGILFDAANPNYIALVICDMLKNESIRINLGREAKRTIRSKYNVMEWARSIEKVYLELLH